MLRPVGLVLAAAFILLADEGGAVANHIPRHPQDGRQTGAQGAAPAPKPEFVIEAEKALEDAKAAVIVEQGLLTQLRQEEAKLRQAAISRTGSWIEPAALWQKKQALKQSIEIKQQAVAAAKRKLARAQSKALTATDDNWSHHHRPSWFRSWWQW